MLQNISGFVVLLIISIAIALIVYALARKSLRSLLEEVVKLPSGTTFYMRLFLIGLVFIALSSALDVQFDLKEKAAFMEYVWRVADGLSSTFGITCLFIVGYLLLITILVAVLRKRNDK
jgi:cbb3-type cytochrome oxidase subunit 3